MACTLPSSPAGEKGASGLDGVAVAVQGHVLAGQHKGDLLGWERALAHADDREGGRLRVVVDVHAAIAPRAPNAKNKCGNSALLSPKKYDSWFKGGVTSNPISWNSQYKSSKEQHKGLLYEDDLIYPQSLNIEVKNGLLWVSVPKVPKRFFMRLIKNYHFADINLFWEDIRLNVQERIQAYFNKVE